MALALYRKYRPATFAEVVGQEHVTEPLMQALASGRINHAYLFSGPRGCGKTSSARILARSLNCETRGPTPDPCGKCDSCVALAPDGPGSLDVIEIDAASHGGVDDARDLRERAFFAPVSSRYKIYIVDEAHMVSTQGFNALLKLVEEPPEFLVFVFATTEPEKVLTTIRSRTHHYPFRLIPPGVLRGLLSSICTAEGIAVEPTVLPLVVRAGGGSARDALSVLDQLIAGSGPEGVTYAHAIGLLGVTDGALLDEMVDALAAGDSAAVYETVDRVVEAGHDPRRFATDLLERLRDLVVLDAVPDANAKGLIDYPPDEVERMTDQAARLGTATLSRMADIVHTGLIEMRGTTSPRLLLELVSARMLLPSAAADGGALLQRLERMERRLSVSGGTAEPAPAPVREAPVREAPVREAPVREAPVREAPVRDAPPAAGTATADEETPAPRPTHSQQDKPEPDRPVRSEPAPAPHTPVGELDAAAVRRIWPEVLDSVKRRRRTAHALLMNVSVQSVDNGVLTLSISSIPLSRLLAQDANTEVVRSALKDVLGVDWRIAVLVDGGGGPAGGALSGGPSGAAAPALDDDPRDDEPSPPTAGGPPARVDPEEAAISLLQSTLGAKRMDG
ncbi:MAG TPA: DNA polymerase III subunit gamma and tau [Mycobacteriales bacterium]